MPVVTCMCGDVYCGPEFEKLRLGKGESMTILPGQVSFFIDLINDGSISIVDDEEHNEPAECESAPKEPPVEARKQPAKLPSVDKREQTIPKKAGELPFRKIMTRYDELSTRPRMGIARRLGLYVGMLTHKYIKV